MNRPILLSLIAVVAVIEAIVLFKAYRTGQAAVAQPPAFVEEPMPIARPPQIDEHQWEDRVKQVNEFLEWGGESSGPPAEWDETQKTIFKQLKPWHERRKVAVKERIEYDKSFGGRQGGQRMLIFGIILLHFPLLLALVAAATEFRDNGPRVGKYVAGATANAVLLLACYGKLFYDLARLGS
jgi:hypothetical protein